MVSGSPVVVEGGETMCSLHTTDGITILTAAGVLIHSWGARDFIQKAIESYEEDPGFNDGDQLFYNDPYLGGQHLADMVIIKPIFYRGKRIAWTGSIMHTAETGGIEPGGMPTSSTEIFHEGIRILGLKIVEGGKFRKDVFNTLVEQVRDPHLMGLDAKAKIAANNVCTRRYLELIEKFGLDFVMKASQKIIKDSEKMARDKLKSLPDGIWRSRMHSDAIMVKGEPTRPFKIVCTMTKEGDEITFDFTGSSPQSGSSINCTLPGTWGQLFVPLCSQLFWDVPWNGGMTAPVKLIIPEGTILNCRYPAACANGVITAGLMASEVAHDCIAKMVFAAGHYEDVNSGWVGITGGGPYFGGINQYGRPVGGLILDGFGAGIGATPYRDGVDTGGGMMNPTSNISDVEILELNIPFMYLSRKNASDSGGFGKYDGGMAPESELMVYGTNQFYVGLVGSGTKTPGAYGMFGGYPPALQESRFVIDSDIINWFKLSKSPHTFEELAKLKGTILDMSNPSPVRPLKEYDILILRAGAGGGYGDPLERDPNKILEDVKLDAISLDTAQKVYGVLINPQTLQLDMKGTEDLRQQIREKRIEQGRRRKERKTFKEKDKEVMVRISEYLEIIKKEGGERMVRCMRCGYEFCEADENYKEYALLRERDMSDIKLRYLLSGESTLVLYQEFICPGCGTLLEVDTFCPSLDEKDKIVWDIQLSI